MAELITMQEAAYKLCVDVRTIRRWISEGRIPAYRFGARLIRLDEHDLFMMGEGVR